MPGKKRSQRARRPAARSSRAARSRIASRGTAGLAAELSAVHERLDMMLPELIARVAAMEHLLVEKGICAHTDLVHARRFIDEQEGW